MDYNYFRKNISKKVFLTPTKPQCVIPWNVPVVAIPGQRHFWSLISGYWKKFTKFQVANQSQF